MQTKIIVLSLTIIAALFLTASCKKDDPFSKDEKAALFAAPSNAEIESIYAEWQARNITPTDYMVVQEKDLLSDKYTLKIVSFKINNIKEYGALIIPNTNAVMPVRIFVGGFGLETPVNSVNLQFDPAGPSNTHILAIPALRGQALQLIINGEVFVTPFSQGNHCDAFDGGTDDVLAFLNLISQTEKNADVNRTSVRGGSRGGTVALLAGIRDQRIKRVVDVVGPTNMLQLTSNNQKDPTYQCQFLTAYQNGSVSISEARNKMIASSPD